VTEVAVIPVKYPEDCCPTGWRWKYACWEAALRSVAGQKWWTLRCFADKLVDHKWFETFIIIIIIGSSISLVSFIISHQDLHQTLFFVLLSPPCNGADIGKFCVCFAIFLSDCLLRNC